MVKIENKIRATAIIPNSWPLSGNLAIKPKVAAAPKIEDKITDPQAAQPIPKKPLNIPKKLVPKIF